jgi:hypothetical protein
MIPPENYDLENETPFQGFCLDLQQDYIVEDCRMYDPTG